MGIRRAGSGLVAIALVAGCGVAPGGNQALAPQATSAVLEARSTQGLLGAFDRVHKAIFDRMDSNKDGTLDEYEAGNSMSLNDFEKADLNLTGKVEYREFIRFATDNGWKGWIPGFGKNDTAQKFAGRFRHYLADRFDRLDINNDGFVKNYELSNKDLQRLQVGLEYPEVNVKVRINAISDDEFKAGDKTADGKLSPAEFEDLFMDLVVKGLTPAPAATGSAKSGKAPAAAK